MEDENKSAMFNFQPDTKMFTEKQTFETLKPSEKQSEMQLVVTAVSVKIYQPFCWLSILNFSPAHPGTLR